jgi:hypothetical protein
MKRIKTRMTNLMIVCGLVASTQSLFSLKCFAIEKRDCAFDERELSRVLPNRIFGPLNLTPEQRETFIQIRLKNNNEFKKEISFLNGARAKLYQELILSDSSDFDLLTQSHKVQKAENNLKDNIFKQMLKMRSALSSDQLKKFNEIMSNNYEKSEKLNLRTSSPEDYWFQ